MQLSETLKLYMTKEQKSLVVMTMNEYINTVNSLVSAASNGTSISKYTTADVKTSLPSALTNQCIRDARSIVNRYNKDCRKFSAKNKKPANQKSSITIKSLQFLFSKDLVAMSIIRTLRLKITALNFQF